MIPLTDNLEPVPSGVRCMYLWADEDMAEWRVQVGNGCFAATFDCYVGLHRGDELAAVLTGFPTQIGDWREFTLGSTTPSEGGSGARFRLVCAGSTGRVYVKIDAYGATEGPNADKDSATFTLPVAAGCLDQFVRQLRAMTEVGATAKLDAAE